MTGTARPEPAGALAALAAATRYEDLPADAVEAAKTFLLDTIGVGLAGSALPKIEALIDAAAGWGDGGGARVLGHARTLPAPAAALVNAYQFHGLEFDAVHEPAVVHPMATLVAALLAEIDRAGPIDGRRLILALVLGVEVATRIGMAATGPIRFFRPATAGGMGSAVALGVLAGLDQDGIHNLLGLQHGQSSGTMQAHVEGSPLLSLQIGVNARAALTALDLGRAGFRGPRDVLTGPFGYLTLFEGQYHLDPLFAGLGQDWQIARLSHKPFPSGRATHGMVDAIQTWRRQVPFDADAVGRVTAFLPPLTHRLVSRPAIPNPEPSYARLCLGHVAAVALRYGTVDVPDYATDRLGDPETLRLARLVECRLDGNPDPNALSPQRFELALTDGRVLALDLPASLGHPDRPLDRPAQLAKFRRNVGYARHGLAPDAADRLIELIDRLETCPDCRAIGRLCQPAP